MRVLSYCLALASSLASLNASSLAAPPAPNAAARWWAHVEELASDGYEGRLTGTAGYDRAAAYVAGRFRRFGLRPAGTNGYLQPVHLTEQRILAQDSAALLASQGTSSTLSIGDDLLLGVRLPQPTHVDASLVFVGYGIHLPEVGYDDFAGQDLRGKVLVYLSGGPGSLSPALKAHAAASLMAAAEHAGAVGIINIPNSRNEDVPWSRRMLLAHAPGMYHSDSGMREVGGTLFTATLNPAQAQRLFARSGHGFSEMLALADAGAAVPRFELGLTLRATVATATRQLESPNVVALLPGRDPALRDQYVVVTAHLDHLGIGEPIRGDRINNGAMDNAAGVASLLEIARAMRANRVRPRRSILFVAVTGEERGRLGSRWFAHHPTVPRQGVVANINMDMYLPVAPLTAVAALGSDESTLGTQVRAAAAENNLTVIPDPQPERNSFVRSDQYSFVTTGVPALMVLFAWPPGSPGLAGKTTWLTERYHSPSDDLTQPVDRAAAAQYTAYILDLTRLIANSPERPAWLPDSFFRRYATNASATSDR